MGCGSSSPVAQLGVDLVPPSSPHAGAGGAAPSPITPTGGGGGKGLGNRRSSGGTSGTIPLVLKFDGRVCILVTDLGGFTKQTRQYGCLHFAAKILRMRQIFYPILVRYTPLLIQTEADNLQVVFDNVQDGVKCALDLFACTKAYNRRVSEKRNRLDLNVGLDWGEVTVEAPTGHLYGQAADGAFLLGDHRADGNLLISPQVRDEIKVAFPGFFDMLRMEKKEDAKLVSPTHLNKQYFIVTQREKKKQTTYGTLDKVLTKKEQEAEKAQEQARQNQLWAFTWADAEDSRFIGQTSTVLTKRCVFDLEATQIEKMDAEITSKFITPKEVAVCVFGFNTTKVTEKFGAQVAFQLKQHVLTLLEPIIEAHGGRSLEETLVVFEHEFEAVACALDMAARVEEYNNSAMSENKKLEPLGFGVHSSPIIVIPHTNVHWGDAVNTASKLGEDLAAPGEVLVSDKVWTNISSLELFKPTDSFKIEMKPLETSGVKFQVASLKGSYDKTIQYPSVEHTFLHAEKAPSRRASGSLTMPNPATLPNGSVDLTSAASSMETPVIVRQVKVGPRSVALNVVDIPAKPKKRVHEKKSVWIEPTPSTAGGSSGSNIGSGSILVTTGVIGEHFSHKLLGTSSSAPRAKELLMARSSAGGASEPEVSRNSQSRSISRSYGRAPDPSPTGDGAGARPSSRSQSRTNRRLSNNPTVTAFITQTKELTPAEKAKVKEEEKVERDISRMLSSPAARMGARVSSQGSLAASLPLGASASSATSSRSASPLPPLANPPTATLSVPNANEKRASGSNLTKRSSSSKRSSGDSKSSPILANATLSPVTPVPTSTPSGGAVSADLTLDAGLPPRARSRSSKRTTSTEKMAVALNVAFSTTPPAPEEKQQQMMTPSDTTSSPTPPTVTSDTPIGSPNPLASPLSTTSIEPPLPPLQPSLSPVHQLAPSSSSASSMVAERGTPPPSAAPPRLLIPIKLKVKKEVEESKEPEVGPASAEVISQPSV